VNEKTLRERVLLPVIIPVGALAFVGFFALFIASILLRVPHNVATAVALMVAFNLLVVFAVVALKPNIGKSLMVLMGGVALVPILLGAVAAAGVVSFPGEEQDEEAGAPAVEIGASNLAFDKTELEVPADQEFEIAFNNEEAQPHNLAILEAQGSPNALFRGEVVTGPNETTYKVDSIAAGSYYFQCDVHPNMSGTVVAA
jgi:plastocyanin